MDGPVQLPGAQPVNRVETGKQLRPGSCGVARPSLADYVTGMGPMDGATAAGGRSCCLSFRGATTSAT